MDEPTYKMPMFPHLGLKKNNLFHCALAGQSGDAAAIGAPRVQRLGRVVTPAAGGGWAEWWRWI